MGSGIRIFLEESPVDERLALPLNFARWRTRNYGLEPAFKRLSERVERQRETCHSLLADLDERDFHRFLPPKLLGNAPKQAAQIVRAWLGLGESNTFETYRKAVEAKGLLVFRSNGYNRRWQIPSFAVPVTTSRLLAYSDQKKCAGAMAAVRELPARFPTTRIMATIAPARTTNEAGPQLRRIQG